MWESKMFTKDQLVLWENKPTANQMWQALQDYFTEKWLERHQYSQATAKHSCFKDAALAAQEQVAAEEEGKVSAMMFALLQEQHKTQLKAMATANQKAMEAMFEQIMPSLVPNARRWTRRTRRPQPATRAKAPAGQRGTEKSAPTAESTCSTSPPIATSLRPTQVSIGRGGSP